ncbi:hypothetical protein DRQ36_07290 [bacterium]|nr:MAG: hypothetical protein DRQ36_07290 [bacterium]
MATLTIDIGNHRVKLALISNCEEIVRREHFLTSEISGQKDSIIEMVDENDTDGIVIGSVVPDATKEFLKALSGYDPLVVTGKTPCGLSIDYDPIETLGADRLAAATGAFREYGEVINCAIMVVDAGSTVTADLISSSGAYHGGSIFPGERLALISLSDGAEQLPMIAFNPHQVVIGSSTAECMLVGVKATIIGAIEHLYHRYGEIHGENPFVIITGASASWIAPELSIPHMVDPDVVLFGLAAIWSYNNE